MACSKRCLRVNLILATFCTHLYTTTYRTMTFNSWIPKTKLTFNDQIKIFVQFSTFLSTFSQNETFARKLKAAGKFEMSQALSHIVRQLMNRRFSAEFFLEKWRVYQTQESVRKPAFRAFLRNKPAILIVKGLIPAFTESIRQLLIQLIGLEFELRSF